jgi:hypothetical protein
MSTTRPKVLVSTAGFDPALEHAVAAACESARVFGVKWSPRDLPAVQRIPDPQLLVGVLPAGERSIPDEYTFLATRAFPELPMLLLCREPLVRETVVIDGGRLTLMGPPLTAERLAERLRRAVPEEGGPGARVFGGEGWWAAALVRPRPEGSPQPAGPMAFVAEGPAAGPAGGFAALLPTGPDAAARGVDAEGARRLLGVLQGAYPASGSGRGGSASGLGIPGSLRDAAGVWLSGSKGHWRFFRPPSAGRAWLVSPSRAPAVWSLSAPAGSGADPFRRLRTVEARAGDVAVLHTDPSGTPWPDGLLGDPVRSADALRAVASGGGPALLAMLEPRLRKSAGPGSAPFAAVIIEVN